MGKHMETGKTELARVLIYGDIHLSSRNYGAHRDYPKETLHLFSEITRVASERNATHIIGLGDMTYGRFHTLEYRLAVEGQLQKQYQLTNGNRYELLGNHDIAGYGMTERSYFVQKGLIRPSENIRIGNTNISMVDYGMHTKTQILDATNENDINVLLAHDYFKFDDSMLPSYGQAIRLEDMQAWYGVDHLICGHIHGRHMFEGLIVNNKNEGHRMTVHYVGCMSRPSYTPGAMDEVGNVVMLTIYSDGDMKYETIDIPLWSLEESFNLEAKAVQKEKKLFGEQLRESVDIGDIVSELAGFERSVGSPESIIMGIANVEDKYKTKALELLKAGMA